MLVDFLIAGVIKAGTTTLFDHLKTHKSTSAPINNLKEVHFFDNDIHFQNDVNYDIYHNHFNQNDKGKLYFESTPAYLWWYNTPKRIWEYNKDMKFIISLRNPIYRAHSHWRFNLNNRHCLQFGTPNFLKDIEEEHKRSKGMLPEQYRQVSFTDMGYYSDQLRRLWYFFPKDQTLIIRFEDIINKPLKTLSKVTSFLDIEPFNIVDDIKSNVTKDKSKLTYREWEVLRDIFVYEIKELERILDWDCSDWLTWDE